MDLAATVSLGSEGALTTISANLDAFGVLVLSFSTALGGGKAIEYKINPLMAVLMGTITGVGVERLATFSSPVSGHFAGRCFTPSQPYSERQFSYSG